MTQDRAERLRRYAMMRAVGIARNKKREQSDKEEVLMSERIAANRKLMTDIWVRLEEATEKGETRIIAPRVARDNLSQRQMLVTLCRDEGLHARIVDDPNYEFAHEGRDMLVEVSVAPFED